MGFFNTNYSAKVPDFMPGFSPPMPPMDIPGAAPKKGGFFKKGGFLRNMVGFMGDGLAGSPVYAQSMLEKKKTEREEQRHEQRRREELEDFMEKERFKLANKEADIPAIAEEERYWRRIGRDDIADDIIAKHRMTTVSEADPVTGEVRYRAVRPSELFTPPSATGNIVPRINSKEELARLPAGSEYIAPDGSRRRKGGASPSTGSAGFPGPY
jgi:hypothetical protein